MNNQHDWLCGFSGCDGGEIGSPENPSIWVCGIEWAGEHKVEDLKRDVVTKLATASAGYEKWEDLVCFPYGIITSKLLAAVNGFNVEEYRQFAEQHQPFVIGSPSRYFQLNLFPIGFKNTSPELWKKEYSEVTGFEDKREYERYCRKHRFNTMNKWVETFQPKLIICFGKSFEDDFNLAFSDGYKSFKEESIEHAVLKWKQNENGTTVAVLPFPNSPTGLKHNSSIQLLGKRLSELMRKQ